MSTQLMAQGLDGTQIDGGWFADMQSFVRATPWLHGSMVACSDYGVVLVAVLMLGAWWLVRRADVVAMAAVLWAPIAVVLAYVVNSLMKNIFTEPRPCRAMPAVHTLLPCDPPTDWAFPSNHSAVVGAAAVALLLAHRTLGLVATALALIVAFSRLYVGAHYPHDVLVGLAVGAVIGVLGIWVRRALAPLVMWLRGTPLAPLVTNIPAPTSTEMSDSHDGADWGPQ